MSAHTPMVVAAVHVMCCRSAEQLGVDFQDAWKVYGEDYLADAAAMLDACGASELLEALQLAYRHLNGGGDSLTPMEHAQAFKLARAAIARATGAAS